MEGQPGMLFHQPVDVSELEFAGTPAHHEHIVNNSIGPVAVVLNALHIFVEVGGDFLDQAPLILAEAVARLIQHLLQLG